MSAVSDPKRAGLTAARDQMSLMLSMKFLVHVEGNLGFCYDGRVLYVRVLGVLDRPMTKRRERPVIEKKPAVRVRAMDRRNVPVKVCTTALEHKELQQAAISAGMTVSTWLRAVGLERARDQRSLPS